MPKFSWRVIKSGLISAGVILAITLFVVLLNIDISKRTDKIEAIRERSETFGVSVAEFEELKSEKTLAQKALEFADNALPDRDQLATFPREMEKLAGEYDLGLGFAFGNETIATEGSVGSIVYDLTASGKFDDLIAFLKEFEAHPYYMSMSSFNIAKSVNNDPSVSSNIFVLKTQGEIFTR
ncbi:MAG: hypothetical protein Q8Q32_03045 [bacterium]|nr:hypothetical protein [bacterium]